MNCLRSVSDFHAWRDKLRAAADPYAPVIMLCGGTGCTALGSAQVHKAFEEEIARCGLADKVLLKRTGCHGFCEKGPVVVIQPDGFFYPGVQPEAIPEILQETVLNGRAIERLLYVDPASGRKITYERDIPFYAGQQRKVFRNNGKIHPVAIDDYVLHDGYAALARALQEYTPEQIIDSVTRAGLRGRGGGGFPTGRKWYLCRHTPGDAKYIICNADEGDPGAFMDRSILEGTPHAVIEGMIIAAYAIGALRGFIYVRAEYPLAVRHTAAALDAARQAGILGDCILGTDLSFDIEIRQGAGAFVCGEETALIASLEGKRGMPNPRPPFPAQSGYLGRPTNINNVETFANVPLIIRDGADAYANIGTEKSKGTKIFALAGRVNNTGLVEVPMGATLRQIVFDIGGGIGKGRKFKAAQLGGPSGGCVPARYLDVELDYDSVQQIGAIMGSGGLIVMDDNTCMVDVARYFLEFVQAESCGKCTACRVGTKKMLDIVTAVCNGTARLEDLSRLENLARHVKKASLCGLGQTAPNPVLSTLRHFREEYEEHIVLKTCRASVCSGLVRVPCQHACPAGVNVPEYLALAAEGRLDEAANIIRRRNPFISVCGRVCDHPCERRCRRSEIDHPLAIRALKRYIADNLKSGGRPLASPAKGVPEVAVIGSGPAGLSCAYFLALMGRPSIIFEAQPLPGGMLALGIPEYRLPKETLAKEIDFILAHGVRLQTGRRIDDINALLSNGYKAVYVATGAQKGKPLDVDGADLDGVVDALELLRDRALGEDSDCSGQTIVIIGGGNSAVDAARSAVRLGAKKVTILYRRTREEMPAYEEEIAAALDEGVELLPLAIPRRVIGAAGRVTAVEFVRARLGTAGDDGRRRPVPIEDSLTCIECEKVVYAIGQIPSCEPARCGGGPAITEWGAIKADPVTGATSHPAVYAGGDCTTGPATVIEAIAAGQKAAVHIDKMLGGSGRLPGDIGFAFTMPDEQKLAAAPPRAAEKTIALSRRTHGFAEVVLGLDREEALAEAGRCLRCDLEK
jgi:NADH-quinone oxidoreductase subunit F